MERAARIFVELPRLDSPEYVERTLDRVDAARPADICLVIDYHQLTPYHGRPPHLRDDGTIDTSKSEGLGYAPFGWTTGWNWARRKISDLIVATNPEYIQQAERPDIRNGWGWHTEPHYHYNDTMSIFKQAATDAAWHGTFVVAEAPGLPRITTSGLIAARIDKPDGAGGFRHVVRERDMEWITDEDEAPEPPSEDGDPDAVVIVVHTENLDQVQWKRLRKFLRSLE